MIPPWRALLRLAWRDARRHPGRALLVVLLVALPVAGVVGAATLTLTALPSADERARPALGAADLAAYPATSDPAAGGEVGHPPDGLPAGAAVAAVWRGDLALSGPASDRPVTVAATGVDLTGPGAGMFDVTSGRAPRAGTTEVALTAPLARRLGVEVGASVRTPAGQAALVGIVRDPMALDREAAVLAPDLPPVPSGYLITLPPGADPAAVAQGLERDGWDVTTRAELGRSDPEELLTILVLGGFGFVVAGLVTAAAFAVSAQRRRHDLALLAASGAGTRQLRRSVFATALLLGTAGSGLGLLVGVLVPVATLPWLPEWTNRAIDGLAVSPAILAGTGAVGVVSAVAAAWLTARSAGRTPVAAALTGRHPPRGSSARLLVAGGVTAGAGLAVTVASTAAASADSAGGTVVTAGGLLLGAALTMLGLGAASPWLVDQLARWLGTRVPVGVRLAMRDTARFRSRTSPIVMAIVAGLGLSVAAGGALESIEAGLARDYRPQLAADQLLLGGPAPAPLAAHLRQQLPVAADGRYTVVAPADPTGASRPLPQYVTVGDEQLLAALDAPEAAADALAAGEVLVLRQAGGPEPPVEQAELIAPAGVREVTLDLAPEAVPPIVLSAETLERSGLARAREATGWLVRLTGPVEPDQLALAQQAAERFGQTVTVETGPPAIDSAAIQIGATAGAGVLSLLIVGVGLALISQEARRDDSVLTVVGASPRVRRGLAAARAGTLTLLGGLLAVPAGLLPVWGLTAASPAGATSQLALPVPSMVAVAVLVPALAAGAAWVLTRPGTATLAP